MACGRELTENFSLTTAREEGDNFCADCLREAGIEPKEQVTHFGPENEEDDELFRIDEEHKEGETDSEQSEGEPLTSLIRMHIGEPTVSRVNDPGVFE